MHHASDLHRPLGDFLFLAFGVPSFITSGPIHLTWLSENEFLTLLPGWDPWFRVALGYRSGGRSVDPSGEEVVEEDQTWPRESTELSTGEDLGRNEFTLLHSGRWIVVTWNSLFTHNIFFQEKATLGTPSVTSSSILWIWWSRSSGVGLRSHLLSFQPVLFHASVSFPETFHILEGSNWVTVAFSSQSLFWVLCSQKRKELSFLHKTRKKRWWSKLDRVL